VTRIRSGDTLSGLKYKQRKNNGQVSEEQEEKRCQPTMARVSVQAEEVAADQV